MKHLLLLVLVAAFHAAVGQTPRVMLDPALQAEAMPVKGRNGFTIGQTIRYGDYLTSKVKRGWVSGFDVPFVVRFQGAKEKLSFTQFGPNGSKALVACISKFRSTELQLIRDYFYLPVKYHNFFAGSLVVDKNGEAWDFVIYNPDGDFLRRTESAGFIQQGSRRIEIQAIRGLEGQPRWMQPLAVYGHEFVIAGKTVGAVSTVNRGTVWIDESLDTQTRTAIAAVATAILLRTDVEGVNMQSPN